MHVRPKIKIVEFPLMFQKKVGWAGIGNEFYFIC
jgi:hypothetical protein